MLTKLLSTPTDQLGKISRFIVFQIKLWTHCAKLLRKNHADQQAAVLAYNTIFGLVPLAVVTLLIFRLFPTYKEVGENVKILVYQSLRLNIEYPNPEDKTQTILLTDHLDKIIDGVFTSMSHGTIALISTIIIIWAALMLLLVIEKSFNDIWHVPKRRNIIQRIINYWTVLTLGPLLIGGGIYVMTKYTVLGHLRETIVSHIGPFLLSYIISTAAFFLLYFVLPNTKVKVRAAIWGAAIAALVWSIAKWVFKLYVVKFIPYSAVYGVLGLIPLTVLWIFISWLIVLFGLQLTFTTQHLKSLDAAEIAAAKKTEEYFIANNLTFINVLREIVVAFESSKSPIESEVLCARLNLPPEFGDKILNHLIKKGLIARTSEPIVGFVPVTDPSNISLKDIDLAVNEASFAQNLDDLPNSLKELTQSQQKNLLQYNLKQIL